MDTPFAPNPAPGPDATLTELAALGLRAARVVTRMMEIEQAAADITASWLPDVTSPATTLDESIATGQGVDAVAEAMAQAVPRVEILARALDRTSRSVRRSIALMRRMQAGWPGAASDNRAAMVRRQVARGVADSIRQHADGEAAERLFDELADRMDDPALRDEILTLPVDQVVRRICRDLAQFRSDMTALMENSADGAAAEARGSWAERQVPRRPPPLRPDTG
ncbi:hypothetical protein [Acidisphaera sp. L21]|uniref:hypothetical protein n=1 Tax=Acidisphaera sp. L21 TaxID=1641851 RepID=UPI00131CA96A|nr:hypothetical protein [Acidisphaera sp. L21]